MTTNEEDFVHYAECIQSLNLAWSILQELGSAEKPSAVRAAAFRYALIEYAKPYTQSRGIHKRRALPAPPLSADLLTLYQKLLNLRHQVLAHTDLTIKEAKLHVHASSGKPYYFISSNYCESLPLRAEIITLIERSLDHMYAESDRWLRTFPIEA